MWAAIIVLIAYGAVMLWAGTGKIKHDYERTERKRQWRIKRFGEKATP